MCTCELMPHRAAAPRSYSSHVDTPTDQSTKRKSVRVWIRRLAATERDKRAQRSRRSAAKKGLRSPSPALTLHKKPFWSEKRSLCVSFGAVLIIAGRRHFISVAKKPDYFLTSEQKTYIEPVCWKRCSFQ